MERISFCIVGPQGAGKSTVASYLKTIFPDYVVISSGSLWDEILGKHLTHYERTVEQKKIVAEKGEGFFVQFLTDKIRRARESDPATGFVVEGVRSREVLEALRYFFGPEMFFVWVSADDGTRMRRSEGRGDEHDFQDRERRDEEQFHVKDLRELCDTSIANNSDDKQAVYREVDLIIDGLHVTKISD
jgi:dephospho-CoA kinase